MTASLLTSQVDAGKLDELIERVAGAPGHSRFLDAAIRAAVEPQHPITDGCPFYTSSTDAALALVERVLPGWALEMTAWPKVGADVTLLEVGPDGWRWSGMARTGAEAPTLPLAIILATLRALKTLSGDSHG